MRQLCRVWKYDGYASKGLAQVAKWGSPRVLESELKSESAHIRQARNDVNVQERRVFTEGF